MTTITVTYHDREEFDLAHNAQHAWDTLQQLQSLVRNQLKHGDDAKNRETLLKVREIVCETLGRLE